jgi:ADP-ribose pyrophosphatase YjhB (NUDIX family)
VRECEEETGINVSDKFQREKVWDDPKRDDRCRIVTVATMFTLTTFVDPVPGDDASEARWFELPEIRLLDMFNDHKQIVNFFAELTQ